jgi:hypothetical protein
MGQGGRQLWAKAAKALALHPRAEGPGLSPPKGRHRKREKRQGKLELAMARPLLPGAGEHITTKMLLVKVGNHDRTHA